MSGDPLVSILMNCYNSEKFLKDAIDSVYAQTYQNFEIIFIDNCSTDNSAHIAKSYDSRLKYYRTPHNMPLYAARAFAMPLLQGDYIAFLDCDDLWKKNKLFLEIKYALKFNASFIFTNTTFFYNKFTCSSFFKNLFLRLEEFKRNLKPSHECSIDTLMKNWNINLQTVLIKRSVIKDLNFNSKLNLIGDYDFFLRLFIINGVAPHYLRQSTSLTRMHENQLSKKSSRNWLVEFRFTYLYYYRNLLTPDQKITYMDDYQLRKAFWEWEKGNHRILLEALSKRKLKSLFYFIQFLRYKFVSLLLIKKF